MATDAKQEISLGLTRNEWNRPDGKLQSAVLELTTAKYSDGLRSSATVFWHSPGSRSHAFGLGGGGDYSKTIARRDSRATQKAIDKQHFQVFTAETIAALTAEALEYYATGKDKR